MKNLTRSLLFVVGCLALLSSGLFAVSRIWKPTTSLKSEHPTETIILSGSNDDSISSIIQSGFNRDSLLQDVEAARQKFTFSMIERIDLLATNTSNGIQLLVDDPSNFIRYLRSPKTVSDLIPALVCDVVFFHSSFGSIRQYSTLMKWRQSYIIQHPGACLLLFRNSVRDPRHASTMAFKLMDHLYLIKAISDGRIITRTKYDELLHSGLMSSSTSDLGRPALKHEDEKSVKEFIRLLTPHMSTGIGIPSNADMSQYPTMMFLDMDTLFTNKSITVPKFLQRIDDGLKLQPILSAHKNETLSDDLIPAPYSSAAADFVIAADLGCDNSKFTTVNTGIHLSRPTSTVAFLLMSALRRYHPRGEYGEQGPLTLELQLMSDFNASQVITECRGEPPRWLRPEYQNRIIFASALSENSTDPGDQALENEIAQLNRKRNEHMEKIWGPPVEYRNGSRVPLVVVVNQKWCNSMFWPARNRAAWGPGDWIAHFTDFPREKQYGVPIRKWICENLDSVAHPEDWPVTPEDCALLINRGFNDGKSRRGRNRGGKRRMG